VKKGCVFLGVLTEERAGDAAMGGEGGLADEEGDAAAKPGGRAAEEEARGDEGVGVLGGALEDDAQHEEDVADVDADFAAEAVGHVGADGVRDAVAQPVDLFRPFSF
jgi:hypothetical protein